MKTLRLSKFGNLSTIDTSSYTRKPESSEIEPREPQISLPGTCFNLNID